MIENSAVGSIIGAPAVGPDGEKIGTVGQVFVEPHTSMPNWATVHTGLFGRHETFVPLDAATFDRESLHLPYNKDTIKDAPHVDTDGPLSPEAESELYRHYGITPDVPDASPVEPESDAAADHDSRDSHDTVVGDDVARDESAPPLGVPIAHTPANAHDRHPDPEAAAAGAEYAEESRRQQGEASDTDARLVDDASTPPRKDGPRHRA
ncbi:PRC-barrel domain containing protein [Salinibacterium sp. dk2585]|uniref:PRC-barrel domain-containing protein n=1 Tax=unclassified Salinibacterium TaxID=2632331 RepID=UPI0011C24D1D|nr:MULTISPECIES: PRC-barrel domain-containing protein [unclassified Salinibacterium]QEE62102.1 PRC-barrel domain containing protein [Salinibacterium sp. dk2585]TXK53454.1 PRC-barrel domain containing protein [Salinibacterium sp. dk5596]